MAQSKDGAPVRVDNWIGAFASKWESVVADGLADRSKADIDASSMESRADRALERAKDIQAFDELLRRHPEALERLRAQGIDLEAEKSRERERIRSANPDMADAEIGARSALAAYLRHADVIRNAVPDEAARKEFDSGLESLKAHAREAGIPYLETVRSAA